MPSNRDSTKVGPAIGEAPPHPTTRQGPTTGACNLITHATAYRQRQCCAKTSAIDRLPVADGRQRAAAERVDPKSEAASATFKGVGAASRRCLSEDRLAGELQLGRVHPFLCVRQGAAEVAMEHEQSEAPVSEVFGQPLPARPQETEDALAPIPRSHSGATVRRRPRALRNRIGGIRSR